MTSVFSIICVALVTAQVCRGGNTDRAQRFLYGIYGQCTDIIDNCAAYGFSVCTSSSYRKWASDNCKQFCGICSVPTVPVPVDGHWGPWSAYYTCSHSCGTGIQTRIRSCNNPAPSSGGVQCFGSIYNSMTCQLQACAVPTVPVPVDGHWGPWSAYSTCSHSCGTGIQTRIRSCNNPAPSGGGGPCFGSIYNSMTCQLQACAADGQWSAWSSWECTRTCGSGTKVRTRTCVFTPDMPKGNDCPGDKAEAGVCSNQACPVVTSNWGQWGAWGSCSASCGQSARTRTRTCGLPSGQLCHGSFQEAEICAKPVCPHWGPYHEGGACSVTCGKGAVQLERRCSTGNSRDCTGSAFDEKPCILPDC